MLIEIFFFKFEFNSPADALALKVMKDNILSTSCLVVNTISFDRLFMGVLERANDIKKTIVY